MKNAATGALNAKMMNYKQHGDVKGSIEGRTAGTLKSRDTLVNFRETWDRHRSLLSCGLSYYVLFTLFIVSIDIITDKMNSFFSLKTIEFR